MTPDIINTNRIASIILYVYLSMTTDAGLEAVREYRKIPLFAKHEGKRRLNQLRETIVTADNRICSIARRDEYIDYLEDVKTAFVEPMQPDLTRYLYTVANIIGRTDFPHATAYATGVIANSIAEIAAEVEDEYIYDALRGKYYSKEGVAYRNSADTIVEARRYSVHGILAALRRCGELFDKDARLRDVGKLESLSELQAINNGAKIVSNQMCNLSRLVDIADDIATKKYPHLCEGAK